MKNEHLNKSAIQLLFDEADKILLLLKNQAIICMSCSIYEEIMDTKMFGFSKKVSFTIKLGVIDEDTGQQLLSHLERPMHETYEEVSENIT